LIHPFETDANIHSAFPEGLSFHDAKLLRVEFISKSSSNLVFQCIAKIEGTKPIYRTIKIELNGIEELTIRHPQDWVYDLEAEQIDSSWKFRWIDQRTGLPMAEVICSSGSITLV